MRGPGFDLLIVGGGINGAGIARDASGRGLRVLLVEAGDLASATSSASSKLIHGGLRYLEHYEFRLVREALGEREVLLGIAPHIAWPLTIVLPHDPSMRPQWLIRAGLFLYDHLAQRMRLPASAAIDLATHPAGRALKPQFTRAFTYADGWVDDARLVVLNAVDAAERGAVIRTRCRFSGARPIDGVWQATIASGEGREETVTARALVNAAGPWVGAVQALASPSGAHGKPRLVKGSHIVLERLYEGDHAYILQQPDGRVVFLIPYEGRFTLIGTTDVPFTDDPATVAINAEEITYLCQAAVRFLAAPVDAGRIVWSYAGVRPLYDDQSANPSAVTRDYVLELEAGPGRPPLLSIFGGKITTYRRLAGHALERLIPHLDGASEKAWTGTKPLPGGDLGEGTPARHLQRLKARHAWLPDLLAARWLRSYGTRVERLIGDARSLSDLGEDLGAGLTAREVDYLVAHEFARTADDILWRRTKLGLHGGAELTQRLKDYLTRTA